MQLQSKIGKLFHQIHFFRAQGTMESFASQIEFIKKEIEKLEKEKIDRQNKVLI